MTFNHWFDYLFLPLAFFCGVGGLVLIFLVEFTDTFGKRNP
jgi:hypothetical protein